MGGAMDKPTAPMAGMNLTALSGQTQQQQQQQQHQHLHGNNKINEINTEILINSNNETISGKTTTAKSITTTAKILDLNQNLTIVTVIRILTNVETTKKMNSKNGRNIPKNNRKKNKNKNKNKNSRKNNQNKNSEIVRNTTGTVKTTPRIIN